MMKTKIGIILVLLKIRIFRENRPQYILRKIKGAVALSGNPLRLVI